METKRLYKSSKEQMIDGVCAGIGEYFAIDPTLVRLVWVLFAFFGAGVLAYIIAMIVIPRRPETTKAPDQ